MDQAAETRLDTSLRLIATAWRHLRGHPRVLAMPALGSLVLALVAVATYLALFALVPGWDPRITIAVATLVTTVPLMLVTTATNAAFLAMVTAAERGEQPTIRDGLRAVRRDPAFGRRPDEPVAGDLAVPFVFGLAMIPGFVLVAAGAMAIEDGSGLGGPLALSAGLALLAPVIVYSRALTELFVLQLGREDRAGPFSEQDLRAATKPKA
jgi:hypothetical protein